MSATVDFSASKAAKNYTKFSARLKLVWKLLKENNEQSVVGCVQIFCDMSHKSLEVVGLTLYPLHIALLDYTDQMRRFQFVFNDIIEAYISVSICMDSEQNIAFKLSPK